MSVPIPFPSPFLAPALPPDISTREGAMAEMDALVEAIENLRDDGREHSGDVLSDPKVAEYYALRSRAVAVIEARRAESLPTSRAYMMIKRVDGSLPKYLGTRAAA